MSRLVTTADKYNRPMQSRVRTRLESLLGSLEHGERLPSERALAVEFGVSRRELRNAFAVLETEGHVWREVGRGTFKGRHPLEQSGGFETLKRLTNPMEVMEARLVIEPELARLATVRATTDDLERLSDLVRKARAFRDFESYSKWDSRFHKGIAEATKHQLFITLYNAVDALRGELAWGSLQRRARTPEWLERASAEHEEICAALIDRDSDAAAESMRQHLKAVYAVLVDRD